MEYMLLIINDREPRAEAGPEIFAEMGKFAMGLAGEGKLKGGSPLHPEAEGVRVRLDGGSPLVQDGPFTETKEIIGGFFTVECDSIEEAVEIAKKCPHAQVGTVEVRQIMPMGPPR